MKQARKRVKQKGYKNVEVIAADACTFSLDGGLEADLVTFSYSLSMIPDFHTAIDNAVTLLGPQGIVGIADFTTSLKHDRPDRQLR